MGSAGERPHSQGGVCVETESSREGAMGHWGQHAPWEVAKSYLCFSRGQADSQLRCRNNGFKFLHLKVSTQKKKSLKTYIQDLSSHNNNIIITEIS